MLHRSSLNSYTRIASENCGRGAARQVQYAEGSGFGRVQNRNRARKQRARKRERDTKSTHHMPRAGPDLELAILGFDFPIRDRLLQLFRVNLQLFRHLLPRHPIFHSRSSKRLPNQPHHGPEFVCAPSVPGRQPTRRESGVGRPFGDELLGPLRVGPDRAVRGRFATKVGVDEGLVGREGSGLVVDVEVEEFGEQEGTEAALDDLCGCKIGSGSKLTRVTFAALLAQKKSARPTRLKK